MKQQEQTGSRWNAGTGMVAGVVVGAIIALSVSFSTGHNSIWSWAVPVGLASGLATGAGSQHRVTKA